MFVTPVVYPLKMLDNYKFIQTIMIWLNPMAGIITNARLAMLGHGALNWPLFNISALMSMVIFSIGMIYFHNAERNFADVI
jgi:ABC-type polysaccharide/polyol phosphate export permease